jgi:hypothetical protein
MPIRVGGSLTKNFATAAPKLAPQHRLLVLVNPMNLKDMFGRIQTNPDNRHSDASFGCVVTPHSLAQLMPLGAVHPNRECRLGTSPNNGGLAMRMPGFTGEAALTERMTATRTGIFYDLSPRAGNSAVMPQWFGVANCVGNVCCSCDGDAGVCVCYKRPVGRPHPILQ